MIVRIPEKKNSGKMLRYIRHSHARFCLTEDTSDLVLCAMILVRFGKGASLVTVLRVDVDATLLPRCGLAR